MRALSPASSLNSLPQSLASIAVNRDVMPRHGRYANAGRVRGSGLIILLNKLKKVRRLGDALLITGFLLAR